MHENEVEKNKKIEKQHKEREGNLMKQFENLKKCMKDTRASYEQTFQTIQTSDHVLKEMSNYGGSTSKKEKYQTPAKELKDTSA